MEQKLFGFNGTIIPTSAVKDLNDEWEQNGIFFSIQNGVFEITFSSKKEEEKALCIAKLFIQAWNFRHDTKLTVNFNHFWEPKDNGDTVHDLSLTENVKLTERVIMTHITTHKLSCGIMARIVNKFDSASFFADQSLVEKCVKDESLRRVLEFYSEEVVDEKRSLYGIYKALEILIEKLKAGGNKGDGMEALGKLTGETKKYVEEVIESTQSQRHAITPARSLLSEQECRNRARRLIEAYADSIEFDISLD